jgi:hypothetical protein
MLTITLVRFDGFDPIILLVVITQLWAKELQTK